MKALILSYNPGMFGEFLATQISRCSEKFVNEQESIHTKENRYLFPNYLYPINLDYKNFPLNCKWNVTDDDIVTLNNVYGNKHICLPTHWFSHNIKLTNIPCYGIRLYSDDITISNLSFCLFWIKSHMLTKTIWKQRKIEILQMIEKNHQYSDQLIKLVENDRYQNWKFLAIKYGAMTNGTPDLYKYINIGYIKSVTQNRKSYALSSDWNMIDSSNLIYGNMSEVKKIEDIIDSNLDIECIKQYANNNIRVLKDTLNLELDDLKHNNWLESLFEYCKSKLSDTDS